MQQKTYASPIFTSQILTDSYAGRDNTSSGPQNRAVIAVIRFLSRHKTDILEHNMSYIYFLKFYIYDIKYFVMLSL